MHWLITGATGLLGPYLVKAADLYAPITDRFDIRYRAQVYTAISAARPDIVIHAAALTDVDGCEKNEEYAYQVNMDGTKNIVDCLKKWTKLVYISTDMVYGGEGNGPYQENQIHPVNVYGASKFWGEREALKHPNTLVLRTNFFGPSLTAGRKSFSDLVLETKPTEAYSDQFSPLHMTTLADLIVELVERGLTGVFNAGSRGGMSKATFADCLLYNNRARTASLSEMLRCDKWPRVKTIDRPPGGAPRPKDMRMDVSRLESRIGRAMPMLYKEIEKL